MGANFPRIRIDREVRGPAITVGSQTIEPVARVKGWAASGGQDNGAGEGDVLKVRPTEVIVRSEDGRAHRVTVTYQQDATTRRLALAGLVVAVSCLLVILFVGFKHGREKRD